MRFVLAVILCVLLAGCGSTVRVNDAESVAIEGEAGLGSPVAQATQDAATPTSAGEPAQTRVPARVSAGSTPRATASAAKTATAKIPTSGRGWDAKYVYVGVVTQKDMQALFQQFGLSIYLGDTERQANAIIADINSRGGIFGRQVKPLFRDIKTIETNQNGESIGESVCTHFTQDHQVVAVWNISTQLDQVATFRSCLAKSKVMLFTVAARAIDDRQLRELSPNYVHTVMVSWDPLAPVLVKRLKAQGYFGGWNPVLGQAAAGAPKVGILVDSSPQGARTAAVLKNALADNGIAGTVVYQYSRPEDGQSSSVNYFNGNGVTHVIVTDVELTAFQSSAESQRYRPRYGITTYNDPYSNLEASGLTPPGANNGAMGVGWAPNLDVGQPNDPGMTPGGASCKQLMDKAGESRSGARLAQAYAFSACDVFRLIAQGAVAGGGLTAAEIYAGIAQIGATYSPANGFAAALTSSRPYVQGVVRDLAWHTDCSCMRYGATQTRL